MEKILDTVYNDDTIVFRKDELYVSDCYIYKKLVTYCLTPKLFLLNNQYIPSDIDDKVQNSKNETKYTKFNSQIIDFYYK